MQDVPQAVQQFITKYIRTVSELEVLLFLRDHADTTFPAEAVGKALLMHGPAVEPRLKTLHESGLLAVSDGRHGLLYQYSPDPEMAAAVDELAKWYALRPVAITTFIFSKPLDNVIRG